MHFNYKEINDEENNLHHISGGTVVNGIVFM